MYFPLIFIYIAKDFLSGLFVMVRYYGNHMISDVSRYYYISCLVLASKPHLSFPLHLANLASSYGEYKPPLSSTASHTFLC